MEQQARRAPIEASIHDTPNVVEQPALAHHVPERISRKPMISRRARVPAAVLSVAAAATSLAVSTAAFAVNAHEGDRLVLLVEVLAQHPSFSAQAARAAVTDAVQRELQLAPDDVALLAPMTLPRTPNGKLMRPACRAMYAAGQLVKLP